MSLRRKLRMSKIDSMPLPPCMLPDGAQPCEGYAQLYAHSRAIEEENKKLKGMLSEDPERGDPNAG